MINLAQKDISHSFVKFIVTSMGVGMLLGIVMIMVGVYRGMVIDAQVLINDINADIWIVQENTLGPFAQSSIIHEDLKNSIKIIKGIDKSEALTFQSLQLPTKYSKMRVFIVGYDPLGDINPINPNNLIAGRAILKSHYEIVVSDKTGYIIGDIIHLGRDNYRVVGITHGSVSSGGEPLVYLSIKDAQKLQFLYSNFRIRSDKKRGIKKNPYPLVNTIVATLKKGYNLNETAKYIKSSIHKNVFTQEQQRQILTKNLIKMASKQIGMFTVILIVVSTIIIGLIIYTMTLEKIKEIAIMKLIGIPNYMIIKMIAQETFVMGILAFLFGYIFSHLMYDKFPKRVVLLNSDELILFIIVLIASFLASLAGIKKVLSANPTEAIGG
jgi:putative ABC transport system permease protein